jgi:hypothetical protein
MYVFDTIDWHAFDTIDLHVFDTIDLHVFDTIDLHIFDTIDLHVSDTIDLHIFDTLWNYKLHAKRSVWLVLSRYVLFLVYTVCRKENIRVFHGGFQRIRVVISVDGLLLHLYNVQC